MANTYTQIYIHLVFATQHRAMFLNTAQCQEVQRYIGGILRNRNQKLLAIQVMPDHAHLLLGLQPNMALSDLARDVKAISSKFINERDWKPAKFHWQRGFGAFSYAHSQLQDVMHYIENQEEHHKRYTFQEEYVTFLKKFGVEFDTRYLFDFM